MKRDTPTNNKRGRSGGKVAPAAPRRRGRKPAQDDFADLIHSDAVTPAIVDEHDFSEPNVVTEAAPHADTAAADDVLGTYLQQMGAIPLLNRDEELAMSQGLDAARRRYRRAALWN